MLVARRSLCAVREAACDSSGNIMPMSAIALIALAGMIGGGVDVSRAYMVKNRLQNACDAGVLAGRRAVSDQGFDEEAEAQANAYFGTNFDESDEDEVETAEDATIAPEPGATVGEDLAGGDEEGTS